MRLLMLPKNTTSKLQPCDQGLIQLSKVKYRVLLGKFLLCKENADKVSLYEVLMVVRAAWNLDVEQSVVLIAWRKRGIFGPPQAESTEQEEDTYNTLATLEEIAEMAELEDQLDVDENAEVSMDAIIDSYLKENEQEDSENDDEYTEPPLTPY